MLYRIISTLCLGIIVIPFITAPAPSLLENDLTSAIVAEMLEVQSSQQSTKDLWSISNCNSDGALLLITPLFNQLEPRISSYGLRFFNAASLNREIGNVLRSSEERASFCQDLGRYYANIYNGFWNYWQVMLELKACTRSCGYVLAAMGESYLTASAPYLRGIVFFNSRDSVLRERFKGDRTHRRLLINNVAVLKNVLELWKQNRSLRIGLDARSTVVGHEDYQAGFSRARIAAVSTWFTDNGVPRTSIDYKWFGDYGPYIDENFADKSPVVSRIYDLYEDIGAPYRIQRVSKNRSAKIYLGLNESIAVYLY